MECLAVPEIPAGSEWVYEIKLDGYRALAIHAAGKRSLYSRNGKSFDRQYPHIIEALAELPLDTVVDGEIVALDDTGRPDFNLLQHFRAKASSICYFVFDLLIYRGYDLTGLPLLERREILNGLLAEPCVKPRPSIPPKHWPGNWCPGRGKILHFLLTIADLPPKEIRLSEVFT